MKAMILAAGRGERMRPLTDTLPKPLLQIAGKSLIEYHIENLRQAGISELIINYAWLGHMIEAQLGDGSRYGVSIQYSKEQQALETAGGIHKVIDAFEASPFIVLNADIFTDYPFTRLIAASERLWSSLSSDSIMAHLVLVPNPAHNPEGDFYCSEQQVHDILPEGAMVSEKYTFSGIACYKPNFFSTLKGGKQTLAPMLRKAMNRQQVSGEIYQGCWSDIGTPQRLREIRALMQKQV